VILFLARGTQCFKNIPEGRRSVVKPSKRWLDDVENDLKKMAVRGWKKNYQGLGTAVN